MIKIKKLSISLKFRTFTTEQFELLNDISSNYEYYKIIKVNNNEGFLFKYMKIKYVMEQKIN